MSSLTLGTDHLLALPIPGEQLWYADLGYQHYFYYHCPKVRATRGCLSVIKISSGLLYVSAHVVLLSASVVARKVGSIVARSVEGGLTLSWTGGLTVSWPGGLTVSWPGGSTVSWPGGLTVSWPGGSTVSLARRVDGIVARRIDAVPTCSRSVVQYGLQWKRLEETPLLLSYSMFYRGLKVELRMCGVKRTPQTTRRNRIVLRATFTASSRLMRAEPVVCGNANSGRHL
eukprot:1177492-Prorocentrum_minimum.AAC.4